MESNHVIRTGTLSGMVLSILPVVSGEDILRTVILAVVGASVSFLVTHLLKHFNRQNDV